MSETEWVDAFQGASVADEQWLYSQNGSARLEPFAGLSHAEVLAMEFPEERMLIDDLVPIGAVGTIAGVPETYKSWQAQHIATAVATSKGGIFGKSVMHSGPVGYFWQDDSTREEAERIKLFDRVHGDGSDIPIRWHLNEGLRLPDDIPRLKITIAQNGYCLVVLDSFYNVLFGKDLKDEAAEQIIAELKMQVCDQTGCTVLIVDHMPWATQENRQRLRAYGGVHKGAAIRFGIYIDAVKNKLYVEARGNNITGFKRRPCEWDADSLTLKFSELKAHIDDEDYEQRVMAYLKEHPGVSTEEVDNNAGGDTSRVGAARRRLKERNEVSWFRKPGNRAQHWMAQPSQMNEVSDGETQMNLDERGFEVSGLPLRGAPEETSLTPQPPADDDIPF